MCVLMLKNSWFYLYLPIGWDIGMFMPQLRHRYSVYAYVKTQVCPSLCWKIVIFMHGFRYVYVYALVETTMCLCLGWNLGMSLVLLRSGYVYAEIEIWVCHWDVCISRFWLWDADVETWVCHWAMSTSRYWLWCSHP